ncbi:MAG: polymer-forming cytoskeletal protein [Bacteroidetes bacterium]|nr:MAG: polymer-forming cytoskeletal protein [Bacteroidota bacterium]
MFSNKEAKKEAEDTMLSSNIIGKGTVIEGNINATGNIRIDGKIVGNIIAKAKVVIGHDAIIEGNITAQNAEIAGFIKGKLDVSDYIILKNTAKINGDIASNKLAMEAGATFNGSCKMVSEMKQIKQLEDGTDSKK